MKAIKVPVYKINPEYIIKKENAGKKPFKRLFLPAKYIKTEEYTEVPESEFYYQPRDFDHERSSYYLSYRMVKINGEINKVEESEYDQMEIIEENAKKVYLKYLYVSTYQNDNYRFYENEIDIEMSLSELKGLV